MPVVSRCPVIHQQWSFEWKEDLAAEMMLAEGEGAQGNCRNHMVPARKHVHTSALKAESLFNGNIKETRSGKKSKG